MGNTLNWEKVIVALDVDDIQYSVKIVKKLASRVRIFKVGLQLFTRNGKQSVQKIRNAGADVFLDLKFHDIPNTVAHAAENATELGVFMFNVHTQGGMEMMRAAKDASVKRAKELCIKPPKVLGVTVLTSLNSANLRRELKINHNAGDYVVTLSKLAKKAGLDGVVASAQEAVKIRKACGKDFLIVTPGIRFSQSAVHDQKRVTAPDEAFAAGADYIVMGRSLLNELNLS